eukprot:7128133-Pyramimonas_sp.AAC.1
MDLHLQVATTARARPSAASAASALARSAVACPAKRRSSGYSPAGQCRVQSGGTAQGTVRWDSAGYSPVVQLR